MLKQKPMAELICPVCGKEMHHAHGCPMVGGLVCEDCHMNCWLLDKTISLYFLEVSSSNGRRKTWLRIKSQRVAVRLPVTSGI